jgi:hypothetical protein
MRKLLSSSAAMLLFSTGFCQEIPFDAEHWNIKAKEQTFKVHGGKQSLYLFQGEAQLNQGDFYTGAIEFKIFGSARRGFPGVHFRIQDERNHEEFYVRLHQSGNPDANQYTPVFNGLSGWQMYYGDGFSAPTEYKMNDWNHIKLIVAEKQAEVYINNMDSPALFISDLKQINKSGKISLATSGPSGFHFADFKVEKSNEVSLKGKANAKKPMPPGTILRWPVSESFSSKRLENKLILDDDVKNGHHWEDVVVEERGYANLSRRAVWSGETDLVFVKLVIDSDQDQVKKLLYGFSDHVKIFLNDRILTEGMDYNSSRDYRFLGTIGYFDAVYLPLKKGKNELWIAVIENFGGWAIMGQFEDMNGIKIK